MVAVSKASSTQLRFKGATSLRHRLVLSALSGRIVRFDDIRHEDDVAPGLNPAEISFIRLLDKITNGSAIEINETGTVLRFRPGVLVGPSSSRVSHDCHPSRSVGYYLEPLLMLAPFCKHPMDITLHGPTHGPTDLNVDTLAAVSVPLLRRLTLGTPLSPEIIVVRRSAASGPDTYAGGKGGTVIFRCDVLKLKIAPVELVDAGVVKRIRGIAFANKVSPSHISQMVDTVRKLLNRFTPDVYVHTDHSNKSDCGAGFGLNLIAETTEGCLLGSDWASVDTSQTPQVVAQRAVSMLLDQVAHGGCVDANHACLALLMCALSDSDMSRIRIGRISEATITFLRDLKTFFGVVFKMKVDESSNRSEHDAHVWEDRKDADDFHDDEQDEEMFARESRLRSDAPSSLFSNGIVCSCIGVGLTNVARQRF